MASASKRDVFARVATVRRSLPRMAVVMSIKGIRKRRDNYGRPLITVPLFPRTLNPYW